jgi:hypothetical protein
MSKLADTFKSKFPAAADGTRPRGTFGSPFIPAAKAEERCEALIHFLWYWEHYLRHLPEVQADPRFRADGTRPGDGTPAGIHKDAQSRNVMRLFLELFKADRPTSEPMEE